MKPHTKTSRAVEDHVHTNPNKKNVCGLKESVRIRVDIAQNICWGQFNETFSNVISK